MNRQQIAWWMWAIGSVLIALSWFSVVSHAVGWMGFGIGMFGSVLGWGLRPPGGDPLGSDSPESSTSELDARPDGTRESGTGPEGADDGPESSNHQP